LNPKSKNQRKTDADAGGGVGEKTLERAAEWRLKSLFVYKASTKQTKSPQSRLSSRKRPSTCGKLYNQKASTSQAQNQKATQSTTCRL